MWFAVTNLLVGGFNLLPLPGLDGGMIADSLRLLAGRGGAFLPMISQCPRFDRLFPSFSLYWGRIKRPRRKFVSAVRKKGKDGFHAYSQIPSFSVPAADSGVADDHGISVGAGRPHAGGSPHCGCRTLNDYETSLGDSDSTLLDGRVWSDKSVSTTDVVFEGDAGGITVTNDSDFLVTYSALATSTQIISETTAPVDVVFVLDFSASMAWGQYENGRGTVTTQAESRVQAMVGRHQRGHQCPSGGQ